MDGLRGDTAPPRPSGPRLRSAADTPPGWSTFQPALPAHISTGLDTRSGRHASAPSGRVPTTATAGESERKPAAGVERLLIVGASPSGPSPTGSSIRACAPVRGRRAAGARRHAIGMLNIGILPEAPWSSSTSSRRPVELGATTRSPCLLHGSLPESPGGPIDRASCAPRGRVWGGLALWAAAATPRSRFSAAGRGS
jgi:hypothetical protein